METVLITGATGILGKEFCKQIIERGDDNLFLTGRSENKLSLLKEELSSIREGVFIDYYPADISDERDREKLFEYFKTKGYKVKTLINVAGVDVQKAFEKYTQEKLVFQTRVNFEAALSFTKFAIEERGEFLKILTVSSISGSTPMPYFSIYSATKSAEKYFFNALRVEMKGKNCYVSTAMPGSIPTRADIIEDIKKQGITGKLSSKPKEVVVKKCLNGLDRNKGVIVVGLFNKLVYLTTKICPVGLQMLFIKKKWSKKEKDAF